MDPLLEAMVAVLQVLVDQMAVREQLEATRHLGPLKMGDHRNQVVVAGNQVLVADRHDRSHDLDQERVPNEEEEEGQGEAKLVVVVAAQLLVSEAPEFHRCILRSPNSESSHPEDQGVLQDLTV